MERISTEGGNGSVLRCRLDRRDASTHYRAGRRVGGVLGDRGWPRGSGRDKDRPAVRGRDGATGHDRAAGPDAHTVRDSDDELDPALGRAARRRE